MQITSVHSEVTDKTAARQDSTLRALWLLAAVTLIGLLIRLWVPRGLWVDEVITVDYARLPLFDIPGVMANSSVHPPLHTMLVASLGRVVGFSEFSVRLPSLIAGVLLIPVLYGLARELFSARTALVAAVVAAVQPFLIWYSQEARAYALMMLLATLCMWAQVRTIRKGTTRSWIAFAFLTAVLMWTHYFTVFQVLAQLVIYAYTVRHRLVAVRPLLASLAVAAVFMLPLIPLAWSQVHVAMRSPNETSFATDESLSIYSVFANLLWGAFGFHSEQVMVLLAALWPLAMLFLLFTLGRRPERAALVLTGIALASILGLLALSTFRRELFEIRYFAIAVPPLLLVAAHVVATAFTGRAWRAVAVLGAALVLLAASVDQQFDPTNPRRYDFRESLASVQKESTPNDVVLVSPVYLTGKDHDDGGVVGYYMHDRDVRSVARSRVLPIGEGSRSIYLVASFLDTPAAQQQTTEVLEELTAAGWRYEGARRQWANVVVWKLS